MQSAAHLESFDQERPTEAIGSKRDSLVTILVQMGIGKDIAPTVASQALTERPNDDLFELVAHIKHLGEIEPAAPPPKVSSRKKEMLAPVHLEDDLRLMRDDDPEESYQILKARGVVIEISSYL